VVDTGVHEQHWSRDQMVEYFHRYTAMDEPNIQTEVDRYIAWPAQALAYKLGQLEILKLREEARQKLGDKFDLRAFHDEVIGSGPLPLDVLDTQVTTWIGRQAKPVGTEDPSRESRSLTPFPTLRTTGFGTTVEGDLLPCRGTASVPVLTMR
jgi:hypothetical protein